MIPMTPKLTTKQIQQIAADYQKAFPEWKLIGGDTLIRRHGPVAQAIWFDRLRTGNYRPTARIHILAAPDEGGGTVVLPQFLGIKNKEISATSHALRLQAVIAALKSEIVPSTIKALQEDDVADLLSSRSSGRPAGAFALACLFAAMGRTDKAREWIAAYHAAFEALRLPSQPSDESRASFLGTLEQWISKASYDSELSRVIEREGAKLGVP